MNDFEITCVSKPPKPYARCIATVLPVLILILVTLTLYLISGEQGQSMFEDLDHWCDQYHPDLSYSACYDKVGLKDE